MKTFILIISMLFGANAFAGNSFCDSRPQQRSKVMCYEQAIAAQNNMIQSNMRELHNVLSPQQFGDLNYQGREWAAEVNNRCTNNLVCIHDSLRNRNTYLAELRRNNKHK